MTIDFDNDKDGVAESSLACAPSSGCISSTSLVPYIEDAFNVDMRLEPEPEPEPEP